MQWHGREEPQGPDGGQGCLQVWMDLHLENSMLMNRTRPLGFPRQIGDMESEACHS